MNNEKVNVFQAIIFIIETIIIIAVFILIRKNFIYPSIKYNKISNYYAGNLENKDNLNNYDTSVVNEETLMNRLWNDFKNKLINDPKQAYKLVNKNSKSVFTNYEIFEKSINKILGSKIIKYRSSGKTISIIDQNNYKYKFVYNSPISYSVSIENSQ